MVRLGSLTSGPHGKEVEGCTRKCVPTCVRGGEGECASCDNTVTMLPCYPVCLYLYHRHSSTPIPNSIYLQVHLALVPSVYERIL